MRAQSSVACTHQGRRDNNEDAHLVHPETDLYLVADGMGGYEGGEVASRIAVETEQARANYGNVVTRALGAQRADPEVASVEVRPGDRFLLCTDGLLERLDDGAIARELGAGSSEDACRRLVDLAFAGGSKDNITAVVVECSG